MEKWYILFILGLIISPFVSAEIFISQTESVYNVQDKLNVSVTLKPNSPVNDFLIIGLVCNEDSLEIYRSSFNLGAGEEREVSLSVILSKSIVGELVGSCHLNAKYGPDYANGQSFELSDKINVNLDVDSGRFDPGQNAIFSGSALKLNGEKVKGFIEINIPDLGLTISKTIEDINFIFNFTFPKDSKSGKHMMNIRVYEKDSSGKLSNQGFYNETIDINQLLTTLEIIVSSQEIFPGDSISYKVYPYDQAGYDIQKQISVTIFEPNNLIFKKEVVNTGENRIINLDLNNTPGYWKIVASSGDYSARKLFYVEEHREVLSSLINDTLIVTNIGNVIFEGPIEIFIGPEKEIKIINLDVGETKKFRLYAPDGNYLISVDDGKSEVALGNSFLTGKAIGVDEIGEGLLISLSSPAIWLLLIILLVAIIVFVKRKFKNRFKIKEPLAQKNKGVSGVSRQIENGKREEATVVAVKINNKALSYNISSQLDRTLSIAKNAGSNIYVDGNYRIILLSPLLTKETNNDIIAVRLAKRIESIFKEHNRKFNEKINFGIAVNNGTIISERRGTEFIFASIGGIISNAKKIAGYSEEEVLLSDSLHKRVISSIKSEKVKSKEAWRVTNIIDREKHKEFIDKFKRN